jgi:hypothetical protein
VKSNPILSLENIFSGWLKELIERMRKIPGDLFMKLNEFSPSRDEIQEDLQTDGQPT